MKIREIGKITATGEDDNIWVENFTFELEPGEVFSNEQEARRAAVNASLDWLEGFIKRQRTRLNTDVEINGEDIIWLGADPEKGNE